MHAAMRLVNLQPSFHNAWQSSMQQCTNKISVLEMHAPSVMVCTANFLFYSLWTQNSKQTFTDVDWEAFQ